jgi:hypothetical protein
MNQITDRFALNQEMLKLIEWDEDRQRWCAEGPFGVSISHCSLLDTVIELRLVFRAAAAAPPTPAPMTATTTATARLLPLYWIGCCTGWRAQIEINGIPLIIGNFRTKSKAQAALDKYFTPTMETP